MEKKTATWGCVLWLTDKREKKARYEKGEEADPDGP